MAKYTTVKIASIILQVVEKTELKGFTKAVLYSLLPDDEELAEWPATKVNHWVKDNNRRMKTICKFMNENNL